jgi:outer membrane receptor protein involved in Fe transport
MNARSLVSPLTPSRLPRRQPLALAIAATLAASFTATTQAQPEELETILVTATRRELSVQDIPLNIAAFDDSLLEAREISDLAELGRSVPGLYVIDQGKRSANSIVVRGLNLNPFASAEFLGNTGGETVATYVGEVPLYVDLALNDVERVEVLLGPQGTLYGAGTLGGAIRYIPRKPQFDDFGLDVRGSAFTLNQSDDLGGRAGATVNVPLSGNLALRASVDQFTDPGFIDAPYMVRQPGLSDPEPNAPALAAANLFGEEDVDGENTTSARVALRWQPADAVDATFTYHHQSMDVGGRTQNHRLSFGTGLYESATRYAEPSERTNELLSAEVVADLGFAELTSATGWSKYDEVGQRDQTDLLLTLEYSYEAFPTFSAFTREIEKEKTFTQEIRLVSQGDGKFSWIGGVFFQDFEQPEADSREFTPGYADYLGGSRPDDLEYISVLYEDLTEKALFGEIAFQITDRWDISLGARYYDFSFDTLGDQDTPLANTVFFGAGPDEINLDLQATTLDDSGSLFKFNTSYRFSEDVLGYFTISEGYRFGAANGIAPCDPNTGQNQNVCALPDEFQYFPDTTTNYELGLRSQWADGRLTLNGALYYIDWQDPQLASATVNGAQPITRNGEGAETSGIEIALDADVTDRFSLGISYSHSKAELTEVAPSLIREFTPPGFGPGANYDQLPPVYLDGQPGDRLPGSPEDQATVYFAYDWTLSSRWDLTLNYGINAVGDVITTTGLRGGGETLGGFSLHHASAVFSGNGPWEFAIYAQNLLDKYAVTGVRSRRSFIQTVADENGDPVRVRSYAEQMVRPREIGFRFNWSLEPSARRGN